MKNPFNVTKAVDYSDEELNNYWVDFPQGGFKSTIKPTSEMPMIILGSKGSGKTHIMKHFSYTMQSLRHGEKLRTGISEDGYIGTYLRCSGLNAYKFSGRGETDHDWETFFSYYLELWLSQLLLNNISNLISTIGIKVDQKELVSQILNLFDKEFHDKDIATLINLSQTLYTLQKKVDFAINNRALTKSKISEKIEVLVSPGKLIFGIPEILSNNVSDFKNLKFLYLLDEYENFTESQQKYFNTLIRERKNPTCFKIGARRYGIRTKQTLSANEEIKYGSEYELLDIDEIFRKNRNEYKLFIKQICIKRLSNSEVDCEEIDIESFFESYSEKKLFEQVKKRGKKHLSRIENKLKKYKIPNSEGIINNLKFNKSPLIERTNIFLLYRSWKRNKDLYKESITINNDAIQFSNSHSKNSNHSKVLDKYKNDIIDYLYRENNIKPQSKIGFSNLVRISNGIPRHFLIIMKHIYRWNEFYGHDIFKSKNQKINAISQINAISDAASWFLEDAKLPGENGNRMKESIIRLCDYLRELRFSDLPPECSISTFSINTKVPSNTIVNMINFLEQYSYLIRVDNGRRNKNDNSRNQTFQVNGLLAVEWELSLARRGIVNLSDIEMKAIFSPEEDKEFRRMTFNSLEHYNAPFFNETQKLDLFSDSI
jgi:hypothetical protein|tara:strand:+ start:671 stop:2638 length:1968 start_codon:yes stop_codon:yes gene_type:complete